LKRSAIIPTVEIPPIVPPHLRGQRKKNACPGKGRGRHAIIHSCVKKKSALVGNKEDGRDLVEHAAKKRGGKGRGGLALLSLLPKSANPSYRLRTTMRKGPILSQREGWSMPTF